MHTISVAAKPSDGNGMDMRGASTIAVRVCVYAMERPDAAQFAALRARLPGHARLALFGVCAAGLTPGGVDQPYAILGVPY